ncbi:MAG: M14 family metallopeptidase [Bacteroidota bacterium]|nr:M14 family metallopeptidase [Bacteroidota bacterium]
MKLVYTVLFSFLITFLFAQGVEDKFLQNKTVTHQEAIVFYQQLAKAYPQSKLFEYEKTDIGLPLHLFVISKDKDFNTASLKDKNKRIILINNGIHPGEPCGIDASMNLAKDLLTNKDMAKLLDNTVVCIIPFYNVGGSLNRGCCSRVNQNGPEEYGFRGNARNLDLNRDFIKCDSENARAFSNLFHIWKPDVFIDTHATNGADYRHTMTVIPTQYNKLHPLLGNFMKNTMLPQLYEKMKSKEYPMCPYVNSVKSTPDEGIIDFLETPRYSTGYAALFNTIGFVSEAHMLKSFPERVKSTYAFLTSVLEFVNQESELIGKLKKEADKDILTRTEFPVSWTLDTTKHELFNFMGYEAKYKKSNVTSMERLYYDTLEPYTKPIKYFTTYFPDIIVNKPEYYIVPQAWKEVIERLKWNQVAVQRLKKDTVLTVQVYYIEDYKTPEKPFEGHYLHSNIKTRIETQNINYNKGDYVISVNQVQNRYIIETLEPQATDGFFAWNFFDGILQQKEWFSPYVFEEKAEEILKNNPELKKEFEEKQKQDEVFLSNSWAQLYFIYQNSVYFEKGYLRYPVARVNEKVALPLE